MTILDKIVEQKRIEVAAAKRSRPADTLRKTGLFDRECLPFKSSVMHPQRTGIIAEFKRASPSKGVINDRVEVQDVVQAYQAAGASAVSVLTDGPFFQGSLEDLQLARSVLDIPLLRKEFIVDEYQITEAKAYGADLILLIAAYLTEEEIKAFSSYAKSLGLYVLIEIHNEEELQRCLWPSIDAIGVNNRNLKDFTVSLDHSYNLVHKIPNEFVKVSESGISNPQTIDDLRGVGYQGFLIGENFMRMDDPGEAIHQFSGQLRSV